MNNYGYEQAKDIISRIKEELEIRYVKWESLGYSYNIKGAEEIIDIIDNHLKKIPDTIRARVKTIMLKQLFNELEVLEKCCNEIDEELARVASE